MFGKTNYNRGVSEKVNYFKLGMDASQRELVGQICPPVKSLAEKGHWAVFTKQHFGYSLPGREGKAIPKMFNCIHRQDFKTKAIIQSCPECVEAAARKAQKEALEARLKTSGASPEQIEAQTRPLTEWLKAHNLSKKWNMLFKTEAGLWGILQLSYEAFKDLEREIKDLRNMGIEDPIAEGAWFRFTRTGAKWNDVKDTVKAVQTRSADGKSFNYKFSVIPESDYPVIEALPDLATLGTVLSYEQISMLVSSGGDENVVKSVFNAPTGTANAPRSSPPPANPNPTNLNDSLAAAQKALAGLKPDDVAAVAEATKAATAKAATPKLTKSLDMDTETFLKEFGS